MISTRRRVLQLLGGATLAATLPRTGFAAGKIKVASVFSVPVDQQWASRIHIALKAAEARGDIEYGWSESTAYADMERVVRDWTQKGSQLVIGEAYSFEKACRQIAADNPTTAFLFGSSLGPTAPNFSVFDDHIDEASYLAGMVAGGMTKTNVIGMVAGYPIPTVNRLMNAFAQGARAVNPKIKILVSFLGTWFDPPKAKEAAFAMVERGADVFYAERDGVSDAAKEKGLFSIGNLVSTQPQFPETVVTSALWHMEPTIDRVVAKIKGKSFTAEDYAPYSSIKYGGASIAPYGTFENKVPMELKAEVKEREAQFKAGTFQVEIDEKEPKSTV